jgi:hypothetical protein
MDVCVGRYICKKRQNRIKIKTMSIMCVRLFVFVQLDQGFR